MMGRQDVAAMVIIVIFTCGIVVGITVWGHLGQEPPPIIYAPPPESECFLVSYVDDVEPLTWQERIPTDMCWASLVGHLFEDRDRSRRVLTTIELGTAP